MDENHVTLPQSTYAVSKLAGERVVFTMHKEHNLPAVIIRPFNSFGPNITQPYIIPEIITQILKGDVVKLGNLAAKRDFTYVSDTARAIILSLVTDGIIGQVINVGSQKSYSIKELVELISEIIDKNVTIEMETSRFRPYDVDVLICNYERASRLLNWKPEISIREGLKETIEWIKKENFTIKSSYTERYGLE
jgi:dTDP-glucose 4,6-dehydratase